MEKEIERQSSGASEYIGTIKERLTIENVEVKHISSYMGGYGPIWIYNFISGDNYLTWFASREQDIEVGDKITLTGTVQKHNVYKDNKVTYINRCKMIKENE